MLITGTVQKQAWVDRTTPPVERVRENIWSIPVDFSRAPVRYTFSYLVTGEAGACVIIDPGWDSEFGRSQIMEGLARAGSSLESVVGIVATHLHPDHLGMVRHMVDLTGAWVALHPHEAGSLESFRSAPAALAKDREWLDGLGVPDEPLEKLLITAETIEYMNALARPTLLVEDGDLLPLPGRALRVVATPGHTPGHICVVDEDNEVVFSGDHVLPRITSNVGLTSTGTRHRALADYYTSLARMKEWGDYEVLPAHEYRFSGLRERIEVLHQHHRERSREILAVVRDTTGQTVWQIAEQITWSRSWSEFDGVNLRAALGETSAHVDNLIESGDLITDPAAPQIVTSADS
jgi:glyoxylase-like metal-dependent hydrolase (beta-lactamase superfamily II)